MSLRYRKHGFTLTEVLLYLLLITSILLLTLPKTIPEETLLINFIDELEEDYHYARAYSYLYGTVMKIHIDNTNRLYSLYATDESFRKEVNINALLTVTMNNPYQIITISYGNITQTAYLTVSTRNVSRAVYIYYQQGAFYVKE